MTQAPEIQIILASSSPYRRELLSRLQVPFEWQAPEIDEQVAAFETPSQTATRLARLKAERVAQDFPHALIIGSDQTAELQGEVINKPGTYAAALEQLARLQGQHVQFHTAVHVRHGDFTWQALVSTEVKYRGLTPLQISNYLDKDASWDCAGSAKIESLGIALVEWVRCDDPTAMIGLPLIALSQVLAQRGVKLL